MDRIILRGRAIPAPLIPPVERAGAAALQSRSGIARWHQRLVPQQGQQTEVWQRIKTLTDGENGVAQVFGGAGNPGGRVDCWTDPKLADLGPI